MNSPSPTTISSPEYISLLANTEDQSIKDDSIRNEKRKQFNVDLSARKNTGDKKHKSAQEEKIVKRQMGPSKTINVNDADIFRVKHESRLENKPQRKAATKNTMVDHGKESFHEFQSARFPSPIATRDVASNVKVPAKGSFAKRERKQKTPAASLHIKWSTPIKVKEKPVRKSTYHQKEKPARKSTYHQKPPHHHHRKHDKRNPIEKSVILKEESFCKRRYRLILCFVISFIILAIGLTILIYFLTRNSNASQNSK